jgi:hypothetical protein
MILIKERDNYHNKYDIDLINNIQNIPDNISCIIYGYLEHISYFENYIDEIKNLFSIDDMSYKKIMNKYGYLLNSTNIIPISIHFRGNEYLTVMNTPYNYEYYNRAIEYIMDNVNNPHFLIFTDDIHSINFNKINITQNNYTVIENDYDYLDLWCMSLCKHNILHKSTFSWWGAFLNNNIDKIVLYDCSITSESYKFFKPI